MTGYDGILVVDKPQGCTSHDVVARLRRILSVKRIGHAGTLDPMATGVLPMFIGNATKAVSYMPGEKSYTAELALGLTTDTQDCTGEVLTRSDERPSLRDMLSVLPKFMGEITQTPPMYSAVQVNGERLYKLARKGIEVERKPRALRVSLLELEPLDLDEFILKVTCSSGGYVRTLIHDLGIQWGCGAVMTALRRTKAGPYGEACSHSLAAIAKAAEDNTVGKMLIPVDSLFSGLPAVSVDSVDERRVRNGADIYRDVTGRVRIYGASGEFLCVSSAEAVDGTARLRAEKNFFQL